MIEIIEISATIIVGLFVGATVMTFLVWWIFWLVNILPS